MSPEEELRLLAAWAREKRVQAAAVNGTYLFAVGLSTTPEEHGRWEVWERDPPPSRADYDTYSRILLQPSLRLVFEDVHLDVAFNKWFEIMQEKKKWKR